MGFVNAVVVVAVAVAVAAAAAAAGEDDEDDDDDDDKMIQLGKYLKEAEWGLGLDNLDWIGYGYGYGYDDWHGY